MDCGEAGGDTGGDRGGVAGEKLGEGEGDGEGLSDGGEVTEGLAGAGEPAVNSTNPVGEGTLSAAAADCVSTVAGGLEGAETPPAVTRLPGAVAADGFVGGWTGAKTAWTDARVGERPTAKGDGSLGGENGASPAEVEDAVSAGVEGGEVGSELDVTGPDTVSAGGKLGTCACVGGGRDPAGARDGDRGVAASGAAFGACPSSELSRLAAGDSAGFVDAAGTRDGDRGVVASGAAFGAWPSAAVSWPPAGEGAGFVNAAGARAGDRGLAVSGAAVRACPSAAVAGAAVGEGATFVDAAGARVGDRGLAVLGAVGAWPSAGDSVSAGGELVTCACVGGGRDAAGARDGDKAVVAVGAKIGACPSAAVSWPPAGDRTGAGSAAGVADGTAAVGGGDVPEP